MKTIKPFDQFFESKLNEQGNGQTVKEFGDLLALLLDRENGLSIEKAINALPPAKARTLGKQISALYKKMFDLSNEGFDMMDESAVNENRTSKINTLAKFIRASNFRKGVDIKTLLQFIYDNFEDITGEEYQEPWDFIGNDFIADIISHFKYGDEVVDAWKEMFESEIVIERNAFLGARAKAIEEDAEEFEFNGKKYPVIKKGDKPVNEGHRLQGVWDYCLADPMGTRVFKKFGISPDDADEIQEICYDVMKRVGDKGSVVMGGGLEINGQPFLRNYSMGNLGPEEIYKKVTKLLKDKYPKLKVVQKWGRMD